MAQKAQDDEAAVRACIAKMKLADMALEVHELIMASAPELKPRLWYGMPGYAKATSSPVILFFRVDEHLSFGMTEKANLARADGTLDAFIESAWFVTNLDDSTKGRIAVIVKNAAR